MSLQHKIDFAVILTVDHANPNGDPLNGNRPRTDYDGFGEISDVCLKRKIRDRLMEHGESIFVQSDDRKIDGMASLKARAESAEYGLGKEAFDPKKYSKEQLAQKACAKWFDVRAFGQLFAFKRDKSADSDGVSIAIRGPVSLQSAFSVEPVSISSIQITKSILNRLIDGRCLTPIEDTDDIWNEITTNKDGSKEYQCKRMSSLFKRILPDGSAEYSDIDRVSCIDISHPTVAYHNGFATRLIDKIFPIQMPYLPLAKPYRVFTEELLYGDKGDYDTVAYLYILLPDGQKIELNRYFKEDETGQLVPMEKEEWDARKAEKKAETKKK